MAEDIFGAYYRRSAARFPHYAKKTSRTSSFIGWPADKSQTADYLAEGGFYYAGKDDCTRCFYCGGGLRNWLPDDDPVVEHARWYPDCKYILVKKGKQWVDRVPIDHPRHYESNDTDVQVGLQKRRDLDEIIERIIKKPCGETLLSWGYSSDIVRAAITSLLRSSDWDESLVTTKALAETAIDMEKESACDLDIESIRTAREIEELQGAVGGVSMDDVGYISLEYSHKVSVQAQTDVDEMIERIIKRPCGDALLFLGYSSDIVRAAITSLLNTLEWDESLVTTKALAEIAIDMEEESASDSDKGNLPTAREIEELQGAVGGVSMEDVGSTSLEYHHQVPVDAPAGHDSSGFRLLPEQRRDAEAGLLRYARRSQRK